MKKATRYLLTCLILLSGALPAWAQEQATLTERVNALRTARGLPAYTRNAVLDGAAQQQAEWMATTGSISHTQSNGSTPVSRAQSLGYPSRWVAENIYGGGNASIEDAWNFWINSSVHYQGLTHVSFTEMGVGVAHLQTGSAYVLVFGNPTTQWNTGVVASTGGQAASNGETNAGAVPPSFVLGTDERGNIQHQIQAGDTLGSIALIYGYTWDDLPMILQLNGMGENNLLEEGEVLLIPPKGGTYTPTPMLETPTPVVTITPLVQAVALNPTRTVPPPSVTPVRIITQNAPSELLASLVTLTPTVGVPITSTAVPSSTRVASSRPSWGWAVAVGLQVFFVLGAGYEFIRNRRNKR